MFLLFLYPFGSFILVVIIWELIRFFSTFVYYSVTISVDTSEKDDLIRVLQIESKYRNLRFSEKGSWEMRRKDKKWKWVKIPKDAIPVLENLLQENKPFWFKVSDNLLHIVSCFYFPQRQRLGSPFVSAIIMRKVVRINTRGKNDIRKSETECALLFTKTTSVIREKRYIKSTPHPCQVHGTQP